MRIYHTIRDNDDYAAVSPRNFPHIFAVCRSITPYPQFQLVAIERVRGSDEYAHYILVNEPLESVETAVIHDGNHEDRHYGQMLILPYCDPNHGPMRDSTEAVRVRFEIRNVFLMTNRERFPVIVFDNADILPPFDSAIIPRNAQMNNSYRENNPHFMMNYLLERRNFRIHQFDIPFHQPGLQNLDRIHQNRSARRRAWMDDFEGGPWRRSRFENPNEYDTVYPIENRIIGGGAGIRSDTNDDVIRARRRERIETPPRRSVNTHAAAGAGASAASVAASAAASATAREPAALPTLQAFTIQALISHAITENMTCPISMNPIQKSTACVTSCQHVFERDSISQWMADHTTCPVCRQSTRMCV